MNDRPTAEFATRADYASLRSDRLDNGPVTVLHIGDRQSVVASGHGSDPEAAIVLAVGAERTSAEFFRHHPPTPWELENAIMTVEDEIARARSIIIDDSVLMTRDSALRAVARIADLPDQPVMTVPLELVEKTFDRLTAVSLGRLAASEGLPDNTAFAATLMILREFMHHMKFASLTIKE